MISPFEKLAETIVHITRVEYKKYQPCLYYATVKTDYDTSSKVQCFERDDKVIMKISPIYMWHLRQKTEYIQGTGETTDEEQPTVTTPKGTVINVSHHHKVEFNVTVPCTDQKPRVGDIVLILEHKQQFFVLDIVSLSGSGIGGIGGIGDIGGIGGIW